MKHLALYLFLSISNLAYCQISFGQEQLLFERHLYADPNTESIFTADINQDNKKDIVVISYEYPSDTAIIWFENINGDFIYNHPKKIIEDAYISNFFVADLNGDSKNDVIITSSYSNDKLYWVENLGDGNFSNENIISLDINNPNKIYSSDMDNDGDFDILVNNSDNEILLFENLGNGNFNSEQVIYSTSKSVKKIVVEDINNDGYLDIVSGHSNGTIFWSENYTNNSFSDKKLITSQADSGRSIGFLDINNDGYKDLISSSYDDDNVKYFLNQNGISFGNQIIIDDSHENPYEIKIIDFDNDGLLDIVISFWTNDKIGWYKNLNNSNWSTLTLLVDNIENPTSFIVEDFNNDNSFEIVTTQKYNGNNLSHFFFDYNTSFYVENKLIFPHSAPHIIKIKDIDDDGKNDIITATYTYLFWNKNKGDGEFTNRKIISNNRYTDIEIIDINDDGLIDIIGAGEESTDIFINHGNENFVQDFTIPLSAAFVESFDINYDGTIDIIISHHNSIDNRNEFYKVINQNNNSFDTPIFIYSKNGYGRSDFKCGDIDLDGDIDIIFNTTGNGSIHKLINNGSGDFSYQLLYNSETSESLELEDLNSDGYLDIVSGYGDPYHINVFYWLRNESGNGFSERIVIDDELSVESIDFADINGNGYKDIIVTNLTNNSENIYCIINNNTDFEYRLLLTALTSQNSLSRDLDLGYLNDDDKIDIATSYSIRYKAGAFFNLSTLNNEDIISKANKKTIIYPNPFTDVLNFSNSYKQKFMISISDLNGHKIFYSNKLNDKVNLEFLKDGMYFIHLKSKEYNLHKIIIKNSNQ